MSGATGVPGESTRGGNQMRGATGVPGESTRGGNQMRGATGVPGGSTRGGNQMRGVALRSEHDWLTIPIPLAEPAVEMIRLHVDPAASSSSALVRFPSGWNRVTPCRYSVDEEVVMLEGELRISGCVIPRGSYAFIPTGVLRFATLTPVRSLAFAWFSGPTGATDDAVDLPVVVLDLASAELDARSPLGGRGRLLRTSANGTCWLVESIADDVVAPGNAAVEVCELSAGAWSRAEPSAPVNPAVGRSIVRLFPTAH